MQKTSLKFGKDFGRDPQDVRFLAMICSIIGSTEQAKAKYDNYIQYGDTNRALALFGGWTRIGLAVYGDDDELRRVESNAIRYCYTQSVMILFY